MLKTTTFSRSVRPGARTPAARRTRAPSTPRPSRAGSRARGPVPRAPRRTRAAPSPRSGCSGSTSRRAPSSSQRSNASRSGSQPCAPRAAARVTDLGAGEQRAALVDGVRRLGDGDEPPLAERDRCANEKIASFEPSVGTISAAASTATPKRRGDPRRDRRPVAPGARPPAGRRRRSSIPSTSASRMNAGVDLARVADAEVDHVEPAAAAPRRATRRGGRTGTARAPARSGESCTLRRYRAGTAAAPRRSARARRSRPARRPRARTASRPGRS